MLFGFSVILFWGDLKQATGFDSGHWFWGTTLYLAVLLTVVGLGSTEERLGSVHHVLCGDGLLDAHLAERRGPQGRRPTKESPRTCVTLVDGCVHPCTYAYVEVTLVRNVNMSSGGSKGGCGTMRWMDR